jgi:hypothetical protein
MVLASPPRIPNMDRLEAMLSERFITLFIDNDI